MLAIVFNGLEILWNSEFRNDDKTTGRILTVYFIVFVNQIAICW